MLDDEDPSERDPAEEVRRKLHDNKHLMELVARAREGLKPGQFIGDFLFDAVREEAASDAADAVVVHHRPRQRETIEEIAKVIVNSPRESLAVIARESGIDPDEFKKLDSADSTQRTQMALRVADAIYASAPRTLGGTARLGQPSEVRERLAAQANGDEPPESEGERVAARATGDEPPESEGVRNVTGTLVGFPTAGATPEVAGSEEDRRDVIPPVTDPAETSYDDDRVAVPGLSPRRNWLWLAVLALLGAGLVIFVAAGGPDDETPRAGAASSQAEPGPGPTASEPQTVEVAPTAASDVTPEPTDPPATSATVPPPAPARGLRKPIPKDIYPDTP